VLIGNIVVVIVTNPMFILLRVHEKFTVKFTVSNVDYELFFIQKTFMGFVSVLLLFVRGEAKKMHGL